MKLFILIQSFLLVIGFCFCLLFNSKIIFKKQLFKNNLYMKTAVCYPEDDEPNNHKYNNNIHDFLQDIHIEMEPKYSYDLDIEKPLYTLIWFPCTECDELIKLMKILNLKYIFININIPNSDYLFPLLYKEDKCVGDNLFDIYEEIYF